MVLHPRLLLRCVTLALACAGCDVAVAPSDGGPGAASLHAPPRGLRRLSNREYDNVVRDLLGDDTHPARRFTADVFANGYDNGSAGLAVQADQVVDYQVAAERLAARVVSDADLRARVLGGCEPSVRGEAACTAAFLDGFAARAWRRPLSPTERQRMADVIAGDLVEGLGMALEVLLQSPQFLYREELGGDYAGPVEHDATEGDELTVRLSDDEVASELAFLLTGSLPDEALWSAVRQGRFHTDDDLQREATRLLGTPAARATLRAFLHQWLGTDRLATLSKSPAVYPEWSPALGRSMSEELDALYDAVLWSGTGSLRELFTTDRGFVDQRLGPLYSVTGPAFGFAPVELDGATRAGVLTRAGFLTAHATADSSGPVGRGVFVLDRMLCRAPSPPPGRVPQVPGPSMGHEQGQTTRQRYEQHTDSDFCRGCHRSIDGVGFSFEEYDGLGRLRTTEAGQPIDSRGQIIGSDESTVDGKVGGASELSARLARSRRLASCFAHQGYRYAMGRIEPGADQLGWLRGPSPTWSTDERITDLLLRIALHPTFRHRSVEPSATAPRPKH